jgi:hypothetical protein
MWFYRGQQSKCIIHGHERSKVHTKMLFHHPLHMLIPICFSEELWTLSWIPLYPHQNNTHVVILITSQNTSYQVTLRVLAGELTNSAICLT